MDDGGLSRGGERHATHPPPLSLALPHLEDAVDHGVQDDVVVAGDHANLCGGGYREKKREEEK